MATPQNEKILLGEAGEHLVISRLLRLGYVASQAPRKWRGDDVLIDQGPTFQVKTTDKGLNWMIGQIRPNHRQFYALVDFRQQITPVVYVLSNKDIREVIERSCEAWQAVHRDSKDIGMRNVLDPWRKGCAPQKYPNGWLEHFRERWDQLPAPVKARPDSES